MWPSELRHTAQLIRRNRRLHLRGKAHSYNLFPQKLYIYYIRCV